MTSATTSFADWLNSTPAETKAERFALSLWSQRKTNPKSEMIQCSKKPIIDFEYREKVSSLVVVVGKITRRNRWAQISHTTGTQANIGT